MKRGIVALVVTFGLASSTHAAPGDPRLVQGILEWPAKLTVEPFVVIRADDGRWYYAEVKSVKRLESAALTSGTRVAVLGTEAARPHELTAIALGPGDAAALALALMPHVNGPGPAAPNGVPAPSAPKASPAESSPTPKAEPTSPPKSAAKPDRHAATPSAAPPPAAAPAVAATPAPTVAPTPATAPTVSPVSAPPSAPAPVISSSAKAAAPAVADSPAPSVPRVVETPAPAPPIAEKTSTAPEPPGDGPRWTELRGTVKVIAGNWIVVRADSGQLVLVDLSTVRGGAASLKPGAGIALYGTPTEQKFQAMGFVQPENRPAAKPATIPPRR